MKKSLIERDWFQIVIFAVWLIMVLACPSYIADTDAWSLPLIIGGLIGAVGSELNHKDNRPSVSRLHFGALLGYCFVSLALIAFSNLSYQEMKDIGKCMIYYSVLTFVIYIIESIIEADKNQKKEKEEWNYLKAHTIVEKGRLFVKTKWKEEEKKPRLEHIIKPIWSNEDVWEIIDIQGEKVTLQSCIEHADDWLPYTQKIYKDDLIWLYTDVSNIFDCYGGNNQLLESYENAIEKLERRRKNIYKRIIDTKQQEAEEETII